MKNKILVISTFIQIMAVPAWAAEGAKQAERGMFEWAVENLVLIMGVAVVIGVFATLWSVMKMMMKVQLMRIYEEEGLESFVEAAKAPQESFWKKMYQRLTDYVPVEREIEVLTDHNYDGIKELDNNLPPWWLWMFYLSIAFAPVYLYYYHWSDRGPDQYEEYEMEVKEAEIAIQAYLDKQADKIDEKNLIALSDSEMLEVGKNLYMENCKVCHGEFGEGGTGPNLTDKYWIHGGGIKEVFSTIKYGVPEKGMIAWKNQMRAKSLHQVASYIMTLKGTDPPNPKAPQGTEWEESTSTPDGADGEGDKIGMK